MPGNKDTSDYGAVLNEFDRLNSELNKLMMSNTRVETVVDGQGKKIDVIDTKVDKIQVDLAKMPDRWKQDAKVIVESCQKQRNDVSAAIDMTEERARAKYGKKDSYPTPAKLTAAAGFWDMMKTIAKIVVPLALVGLAAVGIWIMSSIESSAATDSKVNEQDLSKALQMIQRLEGKVDKLNGGTDAK